MPQQQQQSDQTAPQYIPLALQGFLTGELEPGQFVVCASKRLPDGRAFETIVTITDPEGDPESQNTAELVTMLRRVADGLEANEVKIGREDPRLGRHMAIKKDPETDRRRIEIDGITWPTYTRGTVQIREMRSNHYRDSGGFWPASPDDVQIEASGEVILYEVIIPCFVNEGCLEIEDPDLVEFLPPVGPS